jgi:hypothetical protein
MSPATFSTPIDRTGTGSAARLCNVLLDEFRQFCLGDGGKQTGFKGLADNTAWSLSISTPLPTRGAGADSSRCRPVSRLPRNRSMRS